MMTPFDKLKSLPDATRYLKPGITLEQLDAAASRMSDNEAAALNKARQALNPLLMHSSNLLNDAMVEYE